VVGPFYRRRDIDVISLAENHDGTAARELYARDLLEDLQSSGGVEFGKGPHRTIEGRSDRTS